MGCRSRCVPSRGSALHSCIVACAAHGPLPSRRDQEAFQRSVCRLCQATATVAVFLMVSKDACAEERPWMPRRHHRRLDERIPSDWAKQAVEAEEKLLDERRAQLARAKELARQKEQEDFTRMRMEQEQRQRRAEQIVPQDVPKSSPSDVLPLALWGGIGIAVLWASRSILLRATAGRKKGGKWVFDRSLGGKKVWVDDPEVQGPSQQPVIRESEFERLASVAAAARESIKATAGFSLPEWWNPAPSSFSNPADREAKQAQADRLLTRIEQAKNKGEDYSLGDIIQLRALCQEGSLSVRPKTIGARDAIFRTAVDAAVEQAQDRTAVTALSLADQDAEAPEARFLSSLAGDLNMPEERAVSFVTGSVAAAARARLLEAVTFLKTNDEMGALASLIKLSSLIQNLPALEAGAAEPEMIASSLQAASKLEERQKIFYLMAQLHLEGAALYAELLGFDAKLVVPKLMEDLEAAKTSP